MAPMAASPSSNSSAATAPFRTGLPAGEARNTPTASITTSSTATPLTARWENSMAWAPPAPIGTSSPRHVGQEAPQPAPDPVART